MFNFRKNKLVETTVAWSTGNYGVFRFWEKHKYFLCELFKLDPKKLDAMQFAWYRNSYNYYLESGARYYLWGNSFFTCDITGEYGIAYSTVQTAHDYNALYVPLHANFPDFKLIKKENFCYQVFIHEFVHAVQYLNGYDQRGSDIYKSMLTGTVHTGIQSRKFYCVDNSEYVLLPHEYDANYYAIATVRLMQELGMI